MKLEYQSQSCVFISTHLPVLENREKENEGVRNVAKPARKNEILAGQRNSSPEQRESLPGREIPCRSGEIPCRAEKVLAKAEKVLAGAEKVLS